MLIHNVFFWLKPELSVDERTRFEVELRSLHGIQHAEHVFVGTPADVADRPVLDHSYDFCLTVILKDVAAHDAYQIDPLHKAFIEGNKDHWTKVQVYDAN